MATQSQSNGLGGLAYVLGWVTGIIVLIVAKDSFAKFNAWQSIFFFGSISVLDIIFNTIHLGAINNIIGIIAFVGWIWLMIQGFTGKKYKIPYIGDLAEKQVK